MSAAKTSSSGLKAAPCPEGNGAHAAGLNSWMLEARDRGDQDAFMKVVGASHAMICSVLLRESAEVDLAEEIAQETFVRGWEKRHQYREGTHPRSWLIAIARNLLAEDFRRRSRDRKHLPDLIRHELLRRVPEEEDTGSVEMHQARAKCLGMMKTEHRTLINEIHGRRLPSHVVAGMLGIEACAVRQRLSRIQRWLRACANKRVSHESRCQSAIDQREH